MALITCPECFGNCSDKAAACPHCGFPIPSTTLSLILSREQKELLVQSIITACDQLVDLRETGISKVIAQALLKDTGIDQQYTELFNTIIDFVFDNPGFGRETIRAIIGEKARELL